MEHSAIPIFIAARMSSKRLPGKVLMPIGDKTILGHVIASMRQCTPASQVVVVTSTDPEDDAINHWCDQQGVTVIRGPLENLALRLLLASFHLGATAFVRVSADSPLLDPGLVNYARAAFSEGHYDLVTNVFPRTFPPGQSVEILRSDALASAISQGMSLEECEHVTQAFYRRPSGFRIQNFTVSDVSPDSAIDHDATSVRLCVDEVADIETCAGVLTALQGEPPWRAGWMKCFELAKS